MKFRVFVSLVVLGFATGCNLPTGLPKEFAEVADAMTAMVTDQGVLNQFTSGIDGHIQNPGLETYLSVRTTAGVRIVGVNGEVDLQAEGGGTQLPKGAREALIAQLSGTLSDDQRAAILTILGWNRANPQPPP